MSDQPKDYILLRGLRTWNCQTVIKAGTPSWEWPELSVDDFKDKYDRCVTLETTASDEGADTTGERGTRDANLLLLRAKGMGCLGLAKRHYRKDIAKMRLFEGLHVKSTTVKGILREALALDSAWKQADATYTPETGNTYAAYNTLRVLCVSKAENVSTESTEESEAGGQLRVALNDLYRWSVDWYQEALRRFPANTAHGMMIREQIPTNSSETAVPETPVLVSNYSGGNSVPATFTSIGANHATLNRRAEGATPWDLVAANIPVDADGHGEYTDTFPGPGHWEYQLIPFNHTVEGPPSNIVLVQAD